MSRPPLEVADVLRAYGADYKEKYPVSREHARVMRAIGLCRTAALGGHVQQCDECGHQVISFNSCRNRHCPKCQSLARAAWLEQRQSELLPVEYFHVVFTLPSSLRSITLQNKRVVYDLLFRAASEALLSLSGDKKHLGARIGFFAVLHTWGQNLHLHPHLHCVIPGGGLTSDRQRWIVPRGTKFFLPVRPVAQLFSGKFLALLKQAFREGKLKFHGKLDGLNDPIAFGNFMEPCYLARWVVYCKRPFGGPEHVLKYLGQYTHRIAISNHRLVSVNQGKVAFTWKDYRNGNRRGVLTLDGVEFIRRFLLHVLPDRFVRIRYYGLFANPCRRANLEDCRRLLDVRNFSSPKQQDWRERYQTVSGNTVLICPLCHHGHMVEVQTVSPFLRYRNSS